MFQRVLLIAPPNTSHMGAARPPSGLGYLAQALLDHGIEYAVVDMRTGSPFSSLRAKIQTFQPDLIGISIVSFEYKRVYRLIQDVKRCAPGAALIAGGPHVNILREALLEDCPELDLAVVQEGEKVLIEVCRGERPYAEIPGLLYREGDRVCSGGPPQIIRDLDAVSFPRYAGFDLGRYAPEIPLITSRGCPYHCIFCPNSTMKSQFAYRSATHVVDEIEYWYRRGIRQFNIDDDNFTLIKRRTYEICDQIQKRNLKGLFIRCANGIRADRVDHDLLAQMYRVGMKEIGIGADGGNNHVLRDIVKKGETIEEIEQAIQNALDVGMKVKLFIILGHPGETMWDIEDSFALAERYPFLRVQLYNPIPYPGTVLYAWVREHNALLYPPAEYLNSIQDNEDPHPIFETPELPRETRVRILKRARTLEKTVTRRAAERMLPNLPLIRPLAGWAFATDVGQWLFFNNQLLRFAVDKLWYRSMVR